MCGSASTTRARASCWACGAVGAVPAGAQHGVQAVRAVRAAQPAPTASSAARSSSSVGAGRGDRAGCRGAVPRKTWCSWVTRTTWRRSRPASRSATGTPPTVTVPVPGRSMPASSRPRVDLPAPDGPTRASRSPGPHGQVDAVQHVAAAVVGVAHAGDLDPVVGRRAARGRARPAGRGASPSTRANDGAAALQLLDPHQDRVQRLRQLAQVERRGDDRAQARAAPCACSTPADQQHRRRPART